MLNNSLSFVNKILRFIAIICSIALMIMLVPVSSASDQFVLENQYVVTDENIRQTVFGWFVIFIISMTLKLKNFFCGNVQVIRMEIC